MDTFEGFNEEESDDIMESLLLMENINDLEAEELPALIAALMAKVIDIEDVRIGRGKMKVKVVVKYDELMSVSPTEFQSHMRLTLSTFDFLV